jgi:hypothetical protein
LSLLILPFSVFRIFWTVFFSKLPASHLMCVLSMVCLILDMAAKLSVRVGDDKLVI